MLILELTAGLKTMKAQFKNVSSRTVEFSKATSSYRVFVYIQLHHLSSPVKQVFMLISNVFPCGEHLNQSEETFE